MTAALLLAALTAVSWAQAQTMTPAALGDALLAAPHRPIVEKALLGGGPPPPPGAQVASRFWLWDAGRPSRVAGFCERTRYAVTLRPVIRRADGTEPPSRTASVVRTTQYRLRPAGAQAGCEAPSSDFFPIDGPRDAAPTFAVVRLLAGAQRDPPSGLTGSVDDVLARETIAMAAKDPEHAAWTKANQPETLVAVTDWRVALAQFPVSTIRSVALDGRWSDDDRRIVLSAGGSWLAGLRVVDGRLVDVAFRRLIPAPF